MDDSSNPSGPRTSEPDTARRGWKQDPDRVRADILAVAREVFAETGLSGARVDDIARRTATSKRMIYYYFGDKDGLYRAVLEQAYASVRQAEDALDLGEVPPIEALRQLAEFTFDHHRRNTDFIRLVMIENVHGARHMSQSTDISAENFSAIRHLEDIYSRGCQQGVFRRGLSAVELHWHISALCYFNVSNQPTFSNIFGDALFRDVGQEMLRRHVGDMIVRFALRDGSGATTEPQRPRADSRTILPGLRRFLDVWDGKWAGLRPDATPAERRMRYESISRDLRLPTPPGIDTDEEHWIDTTGGPVRVRLFRRAGAELQPAVIYLHGGGWMQGSPESHWDITARIADWADVTVISVDYALTPDHPYPTAFHQSCGVLGWVAAQAAMLGIDPDRIAVAGDSAGGNLAAALALWARDNGHALRAQGLIYPVCDFDRTRASFVDNANGPLLTTAAMQGADALYCHEADPGDPYLSPLTAPSHAGLAPAYVALAQYDPLRDSGAAYAEALQAAGTEVTVDAGEGLIHGYLRGMEYCPEAEAALRTMCDWLTNRV